YFDHILRTAERRPGVPPGPAAAGSRRLGRARRVLEAMPAPPVVKEARISDLFSAAYARRVVHTPGRCGSSPVWVAGRLWSGCQPCTRAPKRANERGTYVVPEDRCQACHERPSQIRRKPYAASAVQKMLGR